MKKFLLFFTAVFIATATMASDKSEVKVLKSDANATTLVYKIGAMHSQKVATPEGEAIIPTIDDAVPILRKGYPALLRIAESIIIPDYGSAIVSVVDAKYETYQDVKVAPSKGNLLRTVNPAYVPFEYGKIYKKNAFYPTNAAELGKPYIVRDFRGQAVWVNPVQYNPVTKEMRVYTEVTVEVEYTNEKGVNEFDRKKGLEKISDVYDPIYQNHFANYNSAVEKYDPLSEIGNMLIIAPSDYLTAMEPFVTWKKQMGIPTEIVEFSTIGTTASDIETYIADYYADNGLTFVLLVGDSEDVPATSTSNGDSDAAYGYLSGSDSYAEVIIGRFSGSVTDVEMMVQKNLSYEQTPATTDAMYDKFALIASDEGGGGQGDDGESDVQHMRNIRPDLTGFTYTETDSYEFYDGSHGEMDEAGNPTPTDVVDAINNGIGMIGYVGHGSNTAIVTTGFGLSNMGSLTNTTFFPFMFDVACVNGNFVGATCFAEGFVRATYNDEPAGALAVCASTINQSWAPPMDGEDEMVDLLVNSYADNVKHTFGGIHVNGCMHMNDEYGTQGDAMTDTWTIFGDPSVVLRTATPEEMTVSHNAALLLGQDAFTVNCDVDGATVALTVDGEILGTAIVDGGVAEITFDAPTTPAIMTVTATAQNKVPYIQEVDITPADEPYVVFSEMAIDDAAENANGLVDYGETVALDVTLENVAAEGSGYDAANVDVTISVDDPYVTISDNTETYGEIAAGNTAVVEGGFTLSVSDTIPDQHSVLITFAVTGDDAKYNWESTATIRVNAPILEIESMTMANDDDENGRLDPGETADLAFTIANTGHADATEVINHLVAESMYLSVMENTITTSVNAEGNTVVTYAVEASSGAAQGTPVTLELNSYQDIYADTHTENIIIGQLPEINIGTGTETVSYYPFYTYYENNFSQMLYLGDEIGAGEVNIQEISFDITEIGSPDVLTDFSIKVISTDLTEMGSAYADTTGAIEVFFDEAYAMPTSTGWHTFDIEDYVFNATDSNLIVQISWGDNGDWDSPFSVGASATGFTSVAYGYADGETPPEYDGSSADRPNIVLHIEGEAPGTEYQATFNIKDGDDVIDDAMVYIGTMGQLVDVNGQSIFTLYEGDYYYSIMAPGYDAIINEAFTISEDMTMDINLSPDAIGTINAADLKLYPNPNNGTFNITVDGTYNVTVFNTIGNVVHTCEVENKATINLQNAAPGIYFIRLQDGNEVTTQRFVIE